MAEQEIHVLFVEDNAADVELELRELKRAGLRFKHRAVLEEGPFLEALESFKPHVVLSDFSMPGFDGMAALALAREHAPDTPFVFVSGTLGEEYAIRALKNGATDYVLKTNLARLPAAVERSVADGARKRELRRAEIALERARAMAKLAHVITGPQGEFLDWSSNLVEITGIPADALPQSTRAWLENIHPEDRAAFRAKAIEAAKSRGRAEVEYRLRRPDGRSMHVRQVFEPFEQGAGDGRWFSTLQDVTAFAEAQAAAREAESNYRSVFNNATVGIFVVDPGGRVVSANPMLARILGYASAEAMIADIENVARQVYVDPEARGHYRDKLQRAGHVENFETRWRRRDGAEIWVALHGKEVRDEKGQLLHQLGIAEDITARKKAQERLNYLAYYDELTGLANRRLLVDRIASAISGHAQRGDGFALVLVNVERFKTVNDSLGRAGGDALLTELAARLVRLAGDASRVARVAADQFAVLVRGIADEGKAVHVVRAGIAAVEGEAFAWQGTQFRIAVNAGIALFPADGADPDALLRNAEAALKNARGTGTKYVFYTQKMTERAAERLSLETRLRQAVEKEEFLLHYQPKVDAAGRIVGVEALIRWQSPGQGLVPPGHFVPILEETGLIMQAGNWALRRAAQDRRAWAAKGLPAPRVAVNVSAVQLRQDAFLADLRQALGDGSAGDAGVDLEITESLVMEDIEANIRKLQGASGLGMRIAVDDFGTGYSSLAYLAKLPVHSLKIDRAFVNAMQGDANAMTLVSTIVSLAHSLRLKVVAEGVETEAQAGLLRQLRCDEMQGFLFSRPVPPGELEALLAKPALI